MILNYQQIIGFFSGARFVPIITSLAMAVAGAVLAFAWPVVQGGIGQVAILVRESGAYRNILLWCY